MKKTKIVNNEAQPNNTAIRKRKFSASDKALLILAILLLLGAIVLFLWNPVQNYLRGQKTSEMVSQIEQGVATVIVDPNALPVSGEELETFTTTPETTPAATEAIQTTAVTVVTPATPAPTKYDPAEKLTLTALGTIKIDKINLQIPLWDGAGIIPLRYGAGVLGSSARPGQDGNCVILGHRMKTYGSLFNRLDEVAVGDSVVITSVDGTQYTYIIDNVIPALLPADLVNYIQIDNGTGKQLTLITCTPTGVGSHRIVVIGHMA
jgi:LPXTG-site transpeptidase (sortase) family protein